MSWFERWGKPAIAIGILIGCVLLAFALPTCTLPPAQITPTPAPVARVVILPATPTIQVGQTVQLRAVLLSAAGDTLAQGPVILLPGNRILFVMHRPTPVVPDQL